MVIDNTIIGSVRAIEKKSFSNYWTQTEIYEALAKYISMNFDGFHETIDIEKLPAGQDEPVDTRNFLNDMVTFANKDDILTLLIHLGYLGYRSDNKQLIFLIKKYMMHQTGT